MNNDFIQVTQHLGDGRVRCYNIVRHHIGTKDDPLTTIEISGEYKDVPYYVELKDKK